MNSPIARLVAAAALTACALSGPARAATAYALGDNGSSLIRFDTATPGAVTTIGPISGATLQLDGLDFRPSNGLLYGYEDVMGRVYNVNISTGEVTRVSTLSTPTTSYLLGIDFNPVADRLRIVNDAGQNLRANVADGTTVADTPLSFAGGALNIIDAAYTNSFAGATSTAIFYIDYISDTLFTSAAPNSGVLFPVGSLGVDFDANAGFDIFSPGGSNTAYATLRVGGITGLYTINLYTGRATGVGAVGSPLPVFGLAIAPEIAPEITPENAPIPEPGTLALFGVGVSALIGLRRRLSR